MNRAIQLKTALLLNASALVELRINRVTARYHVFCEIRFIWNLIWKVNPEHKLSRSNFQGH